MRKEQIQLELDSKVSELRSELFYRDQVTSHILNTYCKCAKEVNQKEIERIKLETYTRHTGIDGNRFERIVNEISNLFQEFKTIERRKRHKKADAGNID